jgi:prepilin-type processing-associated H-X9-DG protein
VTEFFFDAMGNSPTYSAVRMNLDVISNGDGAGNTLMFSEKCGMQLPTFAIWSGTIPAIAGNSAAVFAAVASGTTPPVFGVAGNKPVPTVEKTVNPLTGGTAPAGYHSRPTANHPGGVVAAFADGHTIFLKDSIAPHVYAQLVTSDSRNVSTPLFLDSLTAPTTGWLFDSGSVYFLQDGDY